MKPNLNRFQVSENPGVTLLSRQYGQDNAETGYKGWEQQPARITELLTRKNGKVYRAVLEFWKKYGGGRSKRIYSSGPRFKVCDEPSQPKTATLSSLTSVNLQILSNLKKK